ncbi:hypothetical protein [Deinococcus cellulosilyticus]|uniref:hypothetical protein n=1 Tax=Deinococcus cellulosilyticus TaxID=401558 RepID=UPI0011BE2D4E|nr:hypothetical protein [Deinococcus cellulosilyticus]
MGFAEAPDQNIIELPGSHIWKNLIEQSGGKCWIVQDGLNHLGFFITCKFNVNKVWKIWGFCKFDSAFNVLFSQQLQQNVSPGDWGQIGLHAVPPDGDLLLTTSMKNKVRRHI